METLTSRPQGPSCLCLLLHWTLRQEDPVDIQRMSDVRCHLHTGLGLAVTILLPLHRLLPGQLELVSQHLMMEIMCHEMMSDVTLSR